MNGVPRYIPHFGADVNVFGKLNEPFIVEHGELTVDFCRNMAAVITWPLKARKYAKKDLL